MANFTLTQNATNVNNAINNVHNAQTTPTSGSALMVTSGGVHTALNNITVTGGSFNLAASAFTTSSAGISSNNVDTKLPTNKAVKAYVDQNSVSPGFYQYTIAAVTNGTPSSKLLNIGGISETTDTTGSSTISTVNVTNDTITITVAGIYQFFYSFPDLSAYMDTNRRGTLFLSTSVNNASYVDKQIYTIADDGASYSSYMPRTIRVTGNNTKAATHRTITEATAASVPIVNSNAGDLKVQLKWDTAHSIYPKLTFSESTLTIVKIA